MPGRLRILKSPFLSPIFSPIYSQNQEMKKALMLASAIAAGSLVNAHGIAQNYALDLKAEGSVSCGKVAKLDGADTYTLQLWFNAGEWTEGAILMKGGEAWSLALGPEGTVIFKTGNSSRDIASGDFKANSWNQLTLIAKEGEGKAIVNGQATALESAPALPAECGELTIGGGFSGRIDEVRLWNIALSDEFNYFIKNTINRWNPDLESLVAYYKFDQKDCKDIVEQTAIWAGNTDDANNHGMASAAGVAKSAVNDNPAMQYRLNGAYTANERFYDRAIPRDQYLLSNDLIILGIEGTTDGHLEYVTPCYHGTPEGKAEYMAEFEGRQGVISFDGNSALNLGKKIWTLDNNQYTFEGWVYIDEWTEGAAIFSKESADGLHGLSLRLGEEARHVLTMRVDGHTYSTLNRIEPGKWHYIVVYPLATPPDARNTFIFMVDGAECQASKTFTDTENSVSVPTGNEDCDMVLGQGLKGKMDNTAFWSTNNLSGTASHMTNGCPMPGFDIVQTADYMRKGVAYYMYDKADHVGFDSYSQDSWRDIMAAAYDGCDGYEIRISVKSHTGWETTISNAERRKIFAADLARLAEGYDGVELDLEWIYGVQTTLGLLAQDIREALPADKSLMISCHNVAYQFPKDKMEYVGGFTFQQYGPQNIHSHYSHFLKMCDAFVNYGFDKEKIITSYATTTSKGYVNGSPTSAIAGVRWHNFLDGDFVPDPEIDSKEVNGYTYYFDGPLQTYNRARYTVDNGFGGIFYWDMGNDVPVEHKYNMAKWCSYGLNSNVEPHVTEVEIIRTSGIENVSGDDNSGAIEVRGNKVIGNGTVKVVNLSGLTVATGEGIADISSLAPGVYIATAEGKSLKFVK